MPATVKLSSTFRISIPKDIRERQNWLPGQEFVFLPKGKNVVILPAPKPEDLFGIAKDACKDGYRDRNDRYFAKGKST